MTRALLLCSLSQEEVAFFQRFKNALAGIGIVFQRPFDPKPSKVFCRCQIENIGMLKGRDRVGLFICVWKPIPPDLAQLLGDHLLTVEKLKALFSDYHDRVIAVNPETVKFLGVQ